MLAYCVRAPPIGGGLEGGAHLWLVLVELLVNNCCCKNHLKSLKNFLQTYYINFTYNNVTKNLQIEYGSVQNSEWGRGEFNPPAACSQWCHPFRDQAIIFVHTKGTQWSLSFAVFATFTMVLRITDEVISFSNILPRSKVYHWCFILELLFLLFLCIIGNYYFQGGLQGFLDPLPQKFYPILHLR